MRKLFTLLSLSALVLLTNLPLGARGGHRGKKHAMKKSFKNIGAPSDRKNQNGPKKKRTEQKPTQTKNPTVTYTPVPGHKSLRIAFYNMR